VVVNLLGVKLDERPTFFAGCLPRLQELRVKHGRPHWIIIDEAHHLLPKDWTPATETLPRDLRQLMLITVHPDWVSRAMLEQVNAVIAVGAEPEQTLASFANAVGSPPPSGAPTQLQPGDVCLWLRDSGEPPLRVAVEPGQLELRRHRRKYASGEIPEQDQFFFTGPEGKLNLRAQNLLIFMQIAEGVDDATWDYHLRRGDYTAWFREAIKDDDLANAAQAIQDDTTLSATDSRRDLRAQIEERYTLPA
jgi:hypothetical protein